MSVSAKTRLVLGHVYWPLMMKLAVKNPLKSKISGASTSRITSAKNACQPGRAWTGLDCELELTTRQRPGFHPSSLKERRCPLGRRGRSCRREVVLSKKRLSRWRGNYSGRIRRRRCTETIHHGASFCHGTDPAGRLCNVAVQSGAASAPSPHRLFEYSWKRSIANARPQRQARCMLHKKSGLRGKVV